MISPSDPFIKIFNKTNNSVNYSFDPDSIRLEEKKLISQDTGIEQKNIISLQQVHGDDIVDIADYPDKNYPIYAEGDALVTPLKNLCLVIRTADCVPVIIYDKKNKILGAVHSGWKGTELDISSKLVKYMNLQYKSNPDNLDVWILPSIGPESYEIKDDVAVHFEDRFLNMNNGIFLNLWKSITESLIDAGIRESRIHQSNICTLKNKKEYFTHRGGDAGRNLNCSYINL
jgi:YfiH family protein